MGLNESITMSFLLVGHTKFTPDACFGLFKKKFRITHTQTLQDIVDVVNNSAECNVAQVVGWENGEVLVPTYDWSTHLIERMKKIPGIKQYHHFTFKSSIPGSVICKEYHDSPEVTINLLKAPWNPTADELPSVVTPAGLSSKRQWYLYDKIRPYCTGDNKDITCPLPSIPRPETPVNSPISIVPSSIPSDSSSVPSNSSSIPSNSVSGSRSVKRARICGNCGIEGHNRRTCSN